MSVFACVSHGGIRSLDENWRIDQSETVKVARAVKQKYKKWGALSWLQTYTRLGEVLKQWDTFTGRN